MDLRRRGCDIHYHLTAEGYEIDFATRDPAGKLSLIQVCWNLDDKATRAREERALKTGERELRVKGRIVTPWDYLVKPVYLEGS